MRKITLPLFVAIFSFAPVATNAIDDVPPSFDQIIELLDLDPSIKERAMAGEIVTYDREDSMERLSVLDSQGSPNGTRVLLGPIRVR